MWTRFMDMHSGGENKTDFEYIYIEAMEDEAKLIFEERFDRDPDNTTCSCCGPDFSISEYASLQEATAYNRGCRCIKVKDEWVYIEEQDPEKSWNKYCTLDEYLKRSDVHVIRSTQPLVA